MDCVSLTCKRKKWIITYWSILHIFKNNYSRLHLHFSSEHSLSGSFMQSKISYRINLRQIIWLVGFRVCNMWLLYQMNHHFRKLKQLFTCTHFYPWLERGIVREKSVLLKNTTHWSCQVWNPDLWSQSPVHQILNHGISHYIPNKCTNKILPYPCIVLPVKFWVFNFLYHVGGSDFV